MERINKTSIEKLIADLKNSIHHSSANIDTVSPGYVLFGFNSPTINYVICIRKIKTDALYDLELHIYNKELNTNFNYYISDLSVLKQILTLVIPRYIVYERPFHCRVTVINKGYHLPLLTLQDEVGFIANWYTEAVAFAVYNNLIILSNGGLHSRTLIRVDNEVPIESVKINKAQASIFWKSIKDRS